MSANWLGGVLLMVAGVAMFVMGALFAILRGIDEVGIAMMAIGTSAGLVGVTLFVAS